MRAAAVFRSSSRRLAWIGLSTCALVFHSPALWASPEQAACLSPATWASLHAAGPQQASASAVLGSSAQQDVVLLGEQHDIADHHRWQLHTLAALHLQRPDMVIGFEAFPRRVQAVLDQWVAGELDDAQFLRAVDWDAVWGFPPHLYMPLFHFARLNRIPMRALNIDRALTRAVATHGRDQVPPEQLAGLGVPASPSPEYLQDLLQTFRAHQPPTKPAEADAATQIGLDSPEFARFVAAQQLWDRAMAEALAAARQRPESATADWSPPLVVGILGSGHVRHGYGVPHQLRALGIDAVHSLLPVPTNHPCATLPKGLADAVFAVPGQTAPPPTPPRLGVSLARHENGVKVVAVTPDSLAAQSGLRADDIITTAAGQALTSLTAFIALVRLQPPGTWLPLSLQRNGKSHELVIKFPVEGTPHR